MTKEEKKEYHHQYYLKNKEIICERNKQMYIDNREHYQKHHKKYYEKNKEYISQKHKEWKKTPNGRACRLAYDYKRNDKTHNRVGNNITPKWIIENIFTKPCAHCGKTGWEIIGCNRIDNSKAHTTDNVEPCCRDCNIKLLKMARGKDGKFTHIVG